MHRTESDNFLLNKFLQQNSDCTWGQGGGLNGHSLSVDPAVGPVKTDLNWYVFEE